MHLLHFSSFRYRFWFFFLITKHLLSLLRLELRIPPPYALKTLSALSHRLDMMNHLDVVLCLLSKCLNEKKALEMGPCFGMAISLF